MEQQFQLKYYGKLTLFEQEQMTAEDRAWFMQRLQKEMKDKAEAEKKQSQSSRRSIPRVPRPKR